MNGVADGCVAPVLLLAARVLRCPEATTFIPKGKVPFRGYIMAYKFVYKVQVLAVDCKLNMDKVFI